MKPAIKLLISGYKRWISPMLPRACRFVPTCSEYALEAVELYGVLSGGWLALKRLLRCHPLASAGFDPVPRKLNYIPHHCSTNASTAFTANDLVRRP